MIYYKLISPYEDKDSLTQTFQEIHYGPGNSTPYN